MIAVLLAGCVGTVDTVGPRRGGRARIDPGNLAATSGARRLSRAELDHVLRDLLLDTTSPATRLLPDAIDAYGPFDNDYTKQRASSALLESLEVLAEDVGTRAVATPEARARLVPCTPTSDGDAECFRTFVRSFVSRAFRRPIEDEEIAAYMPLLAFATEENAEVETDFYTAVDLVVRAVVIDPELLHRLEVGTPVAPGVASLTDHEIATRLSFLLWGTTPDDELLADARAGRLREPAGRRAIAARMFDHEKARDQLHRFHAMWLGYRTIPVPIELALAFDRETSALIDRVVFEEDLDYTSLFTLDETYLDRALATHYGLPAPSGEAGWVSYPAASQRAGILAHGSVLAAFSKFTDTSPTQRGIFVRTRLLCNPVGRPPATVDVDKRPGDGTDAVCKSDRYAAHREPSTSCNGCHSQMDPIGFGLERFDLQGRYRVHDDGLEQCAIEGVGELPGYGTFSGPAELGERIVESGELDDCLVRHVWQFSSGRAPGLADEPEIVDMVTAYQSGGRSLRTFLLAFVASERFAMRTEEPAPEEDG